MEARQMNLTNSKDLKKILKSAADNGWVFDVNKNHIKGKHPTGQTTTISRTPSDGRAFKNIMQTLRIR
jgi:predicted RNA binding protein YcfA (HicA-like mRNA interferase family)